LEEANPTETNVSEALMKEFMFVEVTQLRWENYIRDSHFAFEV
jgi:hypothetical protein